MFGAVITTVALGMIAGIIVSAVRRRMAEAMLGGVKLTLLFLATLAPFFVVVTHWSFPGSRVLQAGLYVLLLSLYTICAFVGLQFRDVVRGSHILFGDERVPRE